MRLGEKLYKEYEAYHKAHPMEHTPEAEYARFYLWVASWILLF